MRGMGASKTNGKPKVVKNGLGDLDLAQKEPLIRKRGKPVPRKRKDRLPKSSRQGARANANKHVLPPAVPKNKSLAEIHEMDPDDPAFKHPGGSKRKYEGPVEEMSLEELVRKDHQDRANGRRARVRKYEAETVKAVEILDKKATKKQTDLDIYDEDLVIAEGILGLEDWDTEELIRGYRRSRSGEFGKPPKFIPREVQQQAFRVLISRGNRKLNQAYIQSVEDLVQLAQSARSEKVKLDAIREIQNRVVGKVPDKVALVQESPYESILADSMVPISEVDPLELEVDDDGTARLLPDVGEG